ncbi:hypothetical protein N7447_004092 [Penicillium robsamsonii]|uniref:uncharacterized protein n=1 Tax=Penicillium robsamsonii TaxID=1792511 RepID=UPI002547A03D|nr:uncharacterized protein N7447_004092 [Penicillium robsamsonii]KAJ5827329.1 hypothetical protein N7447_004092 [Penicillium robsamsonii]
MHLTALLAVGEVPAIVTDLLKLNPGITCPNLDTSKSYCVVGTATDEPTPSTSSTTTAFQLTTTYSAPSNSPTMPGIASNCDGFHKVSSGDQCDTIAKKYSITEAQFKSWNSQVDAKCSNLWLDYFVCVHVPGAVTTSAPQPTAPTGPTPHMPGVVSNCKKYHLIKDGDSCWSIYTEAGIALAQPPSQVKVVGG